MADETQPLLTNRASVRGSRRTSVLAQGWEDRLNDPKYKNENFDVFSKKLDSDQIEEKPIPKEPWNDSSRGCTDPLCIIVLVCAGILFAQVVVYAQTNGDIRRLHKGLDMNGNLCGVDPPVADKPYLYYCQEQFPGTGLDFDHPICVKTCPKGNTTKSRCYRGKKKVSESIDMDTGSVTQTMRYDYALQADYQTTQFAARFCKPMIPAFSSEMSKMMNSDGFTKWMMRAAQLHNAWRVLLVVILIGAIAGMIYIKFLELFAYYVMISLFLISGLVPIGAGSQMIYAARTPGVDSPLSPYGNETFELVVGITLATFGSIILLWLCCARETIEKATACVALACDCMLSSPSLMVFPLFDVFLKVAVLGVMLYYFLLLLSCGDIVKKDVTTDYPIGMDRSFKYSPDEKYFIFLYVFMILWAYEFINALTIFANAFAVRTWFFLDYDETKSSKQGLPCCPTLYGYWYGLYYHLGSIVFGSILIPPVRMLQMALYAVERTMNGDNALAKCLMACLQCLVYTLLKCIEYISTNAFIIIAIDSLNFCSAAWAGIKVCWSELSLFAVVWCANLLFGFIGVVGITCLGLGLCWAMVTFTPELNDPQSENYIVDPFVFLAIAGLINAGAAMCCVSQVGNVTNSIVMCFAYDNLYRKKDSGVLVESYVPDLLLKFYKKEVEDAKQATDDKSDGQAGEKEDGDVESGQT